MDLSKITTRDLKQISKLLVKKESVQAQIDDINRQLEGFGNGKAVSSQINRAGPGQSRKGLSPGRRRSRGSSRGQMKARIVQELKAAGPEGRHFKELAEKLGMKYGNISVWFQSTGRNISEIKKVGPARFAWVE